MDVTCRVYVSNILWSCYGNIDFGSVSQQVLYVPDQDELAKLAPPTVPSEPPVTSSISSVDSETTPTVASETTTTIIAVESEERGEGQTAGEHMETSPALSQEVADDHLFITAKHISEDQVITRVRARQPYCTLLYM